jgi:hypothetical protein
MRTYISIDTAGELSPSKVEEIIGELSLIANRTNKTFVHSADCMRLYQCPFAIGVYGKIDLERDALVKKLNENMYLFARIKEYVPKRK